MNRYTDRPWRQTLLRAAGFAWILVPLTCSGIHDDELRCEEAVAHLQGCCPNFRATKINCQDTTSCGNTTARPQLTLDQSNCILDRSCDDLNKDVSGQGPTCGRADTATANVMTGTLSLCP